MVLQRDGWNDYSYYTLYVAFLALSAQPRDVRALGEVKIMRLGQEQGLATFDKAISGPLSPQTLTGSHCSLSSQKTYYESLAALPQRDVAIAVLIALQDASFLPEVRRRFQSDPCFKISLLRESEARQLLDEGGAYFGLASSAIVEFDAEVVLAGADKGHKFHFNFGTSEDAVSRRVHALVGLNGVGKTQVLARLAMLLSRFSREAEKEKRSVLQSEDKLNPVPSIYNVVAISFSAFDDFERPTEAQGQRFSYSYCGLRTQKGRLRSEDELLADIKELLENKMDDEKRDVLVSVLTNIVRVEDIRSFVYEVTEHAQMYSRLSAGQRIALNSLCHLLSKISARTLVLFDEPELHLHPQLLANMMFAVSEILSRFESFAIVATHSPILIQELPRQCVHVVRRERMKPIVYNPTFETFGENISEITRIVFSATDSDRDYRTVLHRLLVSANYEVDRVSEMFGGKLGLNATVYLESLAATRENDQ